MLDGCSGTKDGDEESVKAASRCRDLFATAKKILPRVPKAVEFILKADGVPDATRREVDITFANHFTAAFNGIPTSVAKLVDAARGAWDML